MNSPEPPRAARRHTSPTGRVLIPVLFVVLIIVLLGRPILISGLELGDDEPEPAVTTPPPRDERKDPEGPTRLAAQYPQACLEQDASPGTGLIASFSSGSVTASTHEGQIAFALRAQAPVGWSPSGSFLATAGADLWSNRGNHIGIAFSRPVDKWAWSPLADCIVGIEKKRLVVVQPRQRAEFLLRGVDISTFAFSPNGKRIVYSVEGEGRTAGIWMADLVTSEVKFLQGAEGWMNVSWTRAMRPILLPNPGDGLSFLPSDEVAFCGNEIFTIYRERIGTLGVTGIPEFIGSDRAARYTAVACSPSGRLLVAVRKEAGGDTSLAVMRPNGSIIQELVEQSGVEDHPMWGPGGVVFAGSVRGEGTAGPFVWFLPEGGSARPSGLRVEGLGDRLDEWLDWSATPPMGRPTA